MSPTPGNGKISYVELPAVDVDRSASFYRAVFGWQTRQRGEGHTAFDHGVVAGERSLGSRAASGFSARHPRLHHGRQHFEALDAVVANGGVVAQPVVGDAPEITARFRDPAGNVIGLYQERG